MAKELTQADKAKAALKIANDAKAIADQTPAPEPKPESKPEPTEPEPEPKKKGDFINPLDAGVTYDEFVASIPKGKSVEAHLKGKVTKAELNWLVEEIANYKNNKKKKEINNILKKLKNGRSYI